MIKRSRIHTHETLIKGVLGMFLSYDGGFSVLPAFPVLN